MKAVVTGASSGIGKAIYDYLKCFEKMKVHGVSRRGPDNWMDLSRGGLLAWESIPKAVDILILNHGVLHFNERAESDILVQTNLLSYFRILEQIQLTEKVVKAGGVVLLNASVAGVIGDADVPLYAALKAGVINLAKSYAKRLMKRNIRVNSFSCGFVKTNLVEGDTPQELVDTIPMGREAEVEELLPIIGALIASRYMTGQNVILDGGLSL